MFAQKRVVLAALCTAFLTLALTAGLASADTITDNGVDLNDQGVLVPAGFDPEQLSVALVDPGTVSGSPFRFVSPLMDIQFMSGAAEVDIPSKLTYVYFNMNHIERSAWDQGRAGIYFQTPSASAWTACSSTFLVSGENPPHGRLACIAPQSGIYGLGILEQLTELVPGAQVGPGVETATYITENTAQTGNQGIFVPAGFDPDLIALRLVEPGVEAVPDYDFEVRRLLVRIDWVGDEQPVILTQGQDPETETSNSTDEPASPQSLTYVFYVLDHFSRRLWDDGSLSIYFYDTAAGAWQTCPSILIAQGQYGTVSCVATQFTYYALGISSTEDALGSE
jgi:hypothetical protein